MMNDGSISVRCKLRRLLPWLLGLGCLVAWLRCRLLLTTPTVHDTRGCFCIPLSTHLCCFAPLLSRTARVFVVLRPLKFFAQKEGRGKNHDPRHDSNCRLHFNHPSHLFYSTQAHQKSTLIMDLIAISQQ